jgi:hypothetical protein
VSKYTSQLRKALGLPWQGALDLPVGVSLTHITGVVALREASRRQLLVNAEGE